MRFLPFVLSIGFLLATYAAYVEYKFAEAQRLGLQYKAFCDIGMFSCTKVFSSEFGHASQYLGLPRISNAVVGMAFYLVAILFERNLPVLLFMSVTSSIGSCVLFYILTVMMNDFCIVCFSIYVVNFTTLYVAIRRWQRKAKEGSRRTASPPKPKTK
jgi:vitamin-K-epoxide reductase (warfarin-sensitive)